MLIPLPTLKTSQFPQHILYEKRSILDVLENGSPDELWSLLADYGMCSNYDYEGIKRAFEKLIEKLKKSNYNLGGVI